jgi:DNA-directed RNA polymerase subunit E'
MQELCLGRIKDILDFGAFLTIGPIEGMIHLSQSMDDYVSFSKEKTLQGRDSKRSLKIGDTCRARVVAVSYKDLANPKIALTMRQVGLGKLEWIPEDIARGSQRAERVAPAAKSGGKEKKEGK